MIEHDRFLFIGAGGKGCLILFGIDGAQILIAQVIPLFRMGLVEWRVVQWMIDTAHACAQFGGQRLAKGLDGYFMKGLGVIAKDIAIDRLPSDLWATRQWSEAIDLANAGFGVFAVADAMASRLTASANLAGDRLRQSGVQMVNTEMAIFELLGRAGTAEFKQLSALIR